MRSIFRGESDIGLVKWSTPRAADALPDEDPEAGQPKGDGDEEEKETRCEGLVRADAEIAEEADEERLPHSEPVDGERDEQDEKEQRTHHVVGPRKIGRASCRER